MQSIQLTVEDTIELKNMLKGSRTQTQHNFSISFLIAHLEREKIHYVKFRVYRFCRFPKILIISKGVVIEFYKYTRLLVLIFVILHRMT